MLKRLFCAAALALAAADDQDAWVAEPDGSQQLERVPLPKTGQLHDSFADLPTDCELLIDVAASSVNPVDRTFPGISTERVMGSDLCGVVAARGDGCSEPARLPVGTRVWGDIGANVFYAANGTKTKENGVFGRAAISFLPSPRRRRVVAAISFLLSPASSPRRRRVVAASSPRPRRRRRPTRPSPSRSNRSWGSRPSRRRPPCAAPYQRSR